MADQSWGLVMVMKQLSIAIAVSICIGSAIWIGSAMARSDLNTYAAAPASETKIDFDQVFSLLPGYIDRARKSDRLPNFKSIVSEPALLPYCEPVASPFADPILGRIVGRCAA